jgi:hypothetical protein
MSFFEVDIDMVGTSIGCEVSGVHLPCKAKDESGRWEVESASHLAKQAATIPFFPLVYSVRTPDSHGMPTASDADPRFNEFIILQAQNAGLFLGQIPNPHSGEKQINLRAAKSVIDSLEMLASKTQGNLTASEAKLLATALDNLRPLFEAAIASADH